ncbi:MAG TPA: LolA-related protein [Opitutaceae bacterium]
MTITLRVPDTARSNQPIPPFGNAGPVLRCACLFFTVFLALLCPAAEPPSSPGALVTAGENDAAWRPLFTALAAKTPVRSAFTERRWFSLRKRPIELKGEMRLDADHGLSLRYVEPQEQAVIVDQQGVLLRDGQGRSRPAPDDPRASAAPAALLPVLRFDFDQLLQRFELRAVRNDDVWRLDFTPRDEQLAGILGHITVIGAGEAVTRLEFRRTPTQRVEIFIGKTTTGEPFTADEIARFFR